MKTIVYIVKDNFVIKKAKIKNDQTFFEHNKKRYVIDSRPTLLTNKKRIYVFQEGNACKMYLNEADRVSSALVDKIVKNRVIPIDYDATQKLTNLLPIAISLFSVLLQIVISLKLFGII